MCVFVYVKCITLCLSLFVCLCYTLSGLTVIWRINVFIMSQNKSTFVHSCVLRLADYRQRSAASDTFYSFYVLSLIGRSSSLETEALFSVLRFVYDVPIIIFLLFIQSNIIIPGKCEKGKRGNLRVTCLSAP